MESSDSILQATLRYRGIQGMYFLNKRGDIGYITADSNKAVRETFPQINNRELLKKHPDFMEQLEGFLLQTGEIPGALLDHGKACEIELGYIVPPDENQPWNSSNFVLHNHVIEGLRIDDAMTSAGKFQSPLGVGVDEDRYQTVRSLYQGFAHLLYHKNAFGVHQYFPVLFKLPGANLNSTTPQEKAPLRVLNLKWSKSDDMGLSAERFARFPAIFSILRANMVKRGAIILDDSKTIVAVS